MPEDHAPANSGTVVTVSNWLPTVRAAGIPALCVVLLALCAGLATHSLLGVPAAGQPGALSAHWQPSEGSDEENRPAHVPGDNHCAAPARDASSTSDTAALLLDPATGDQEFPSAFHRTSAARPRPAPPSPGRDVLIATCVSRT